MARKLAEMLVLPERIELSTSPLPRECSTTELRQLGLAPARHGMHEAQALGKASARSWPDPLAGLDVSSRGRSGTRDKSPCFRMSFRALWLSPFGDKPGA